MALCTACGGTGTIPCPNCGGTGMNPSEEGKPNVREPGIEIDRCTRCSGTGEIICTHCGGTGAMPVQSHVLQQGGGWFKIPLLIP